jgi:SAM-dependent methyltransferase
VGRPGYPEEILRWALPAQASQVVDLGAGTGLLTAGLLDLGLHVTAVEPLAKMRERIPAPAKAVDGSAEAIPVADGAADAVFAGQAWHWFDAERAIAEAARVLRPGGTLALMWNLLDDDDPLSRTVADILDAEERGNLLVDEPAPPFEETAWFPHPQRRLVRHAERYDVDRVIAFAASRSQTILLAPDDREALFSQLREQLPPGEFEVRWWCEAWRAERAGLPRYLGATA